MTAGSSVKIRSPSARRCLRCVRDAWHPTSTRSTPAECEEVRAYVEAQAHDDVAHLEKAASELVGLNRHEIWDVHCQGSRWWVVTNMTNLYSQTDFKSRDVVLTFHVGLMTRLVQQQERDTPVTPDAAAMLPGSWRRWEQAWETFDAGDEAEDFQAVGAARLTCKQIPSLRPRAADVQQGANAHLRPQSYRFLDDLPESIRHYVSIDVEQCKYSAMAWRGWFRRVAVSWLWRESGGVSAGCWWGVVGSS